MRNGWIKLHRKMLDNKFLKYDRTSWIIFVYLLLLVDKSNGKWEGGRFQLAEYLEINPNTLYKSLKRLEKAKMVTLDSNNKYTTYSIVNWHKYQGGSNNQINNQVTTDEQPSNTLTRSKEVKKNTKEVLIYYNKLFNKNLKSTKSFDDNFSYWNETYTLKEIKKAFYNAKKDDYWKDKIDPTIMFRKKNPNKENVDWIGHFLNNKSNNFIEDVIEEGIQ